MSNRTCLVAWLGSLWMVGCVNGVDSQGSSKDPISGESCTTEGESVSCSSDDKKQIVCGYDAVDTLVWSACAVQACTENASRACMVTVVVGSVGGVDQTAQVSGTQSCERSDAGTYDWGQCVSSSMSTPLVFSFDGRPATLTQAPGAFSVSPVMSVATDWPTAKTPWLALDRNHNGRIDDGGELFGSATSLSVGGFAPNGFAALAELDKNGDGRITADDPGFSSLVVWSDLNQDRASQPNELQSLFDLGIVSIGLGFKNTTHCDERGNCEIEASTFVYRDTLGGEHTGRVADVHLRHQP